MDSNNKCMAICCVVCLLLGILVKTILDHEQAIAEKAIDQGLVQQKVRFRYEPIWVKPEHYVPFPINSADTYLEYRRSLEPETE